MGSVKYRGMREATYVLLDETRMGPYTPEQLHGLMISGKINDDTLCWHEGMEEWETFAKYFRGEETQASAFEGIQIQGTDLNGLHYSVSGEDVMLGREVFAISGVRGAKLATERIDRGYSRFRVILFGFILVMIASLYYLESEEVLRLGGGPIVVGVVSLLLLIFLVRSAVVAFRAPNNFVEMRLTNDDSRMIHLPKKTALKVIDLITNIVRAQDVE